MRSRHVFGASVLAMGLTAAAGCESGDFDATEKDGDVVSTEQASTWATASDITIAQTFRPRIKLRSDQNCWPLSFKEISPYANPVDRDGLKDKCSHSTGGNFAVFASVKRPTQLPGVSVDDDSLRVSYGVAFGWQSNHVPGALGDMLDGNHGEDAQYVIADVVKGQLTSVWADLHKGHYARSKSQLTMYDDNRVTIWVGKWYNSLKLLTDLTAYCSSTTRFLLSLSGLGAIAGDYTCDQLDTATNFGDPVGSNHEMDGTLIMVEDVCNTTGSSYTAPDGTLYSGEQLNGLKAYIGCSGVSSPWTKSFKSKDSYSDPYGLTGCNSGDTTFGRICAASNFGANDPWTTLKGNAYAEPYTVGNSDVDDNAGNHFTDLVTANSTSPTAITIYTGERVDGLKITYVDNGITTVKTHGSEDPSHAKTLSNLDTDPIVSVKMCEGTAPNGHKRAGRIEIVTAAGRTISGGSGTSKCVTSAPSGQRLFGFWGISGEEIDFLGTYWGSNIPSSQSMTSWFGDSNQGGGMALTNIDSDSRPDAVVVHIDNPVGGNNGYYRVLWNMDWVKPTQGNSTYLPTTMGDPIPINGWWGAENSGAGVALGDIDKNGRPDIVVVHIDNPGGSDSTYYRIGWNMNTSGVVTSWSTPMSIAAGFHGYDTSGTDVALRDIDNNGTVDMVVGTVDNASGADIVYYNVGMNLSTTGNVSSWSAAATLPATISTNTADLGMELADMDGNGKPDLIVSWVDSAAGNDVHSYRVGYDVTSSGGTSGWSNVRVLNSALGAATQGADVAAYDFWGYGNKSLANFHIADETGGNIGWWNVKANQSDVVYALKGKQSQKCLTIQNGSATNGDKLVIAPCTYSESQKFTFSAADAGGYHFIVKSSGKCVDNPNFSAQNGTLQQQWACNYENSQRFTIALNEDWSYSVKNAGNNLCFDVANAWTTDGAPIVQWSCHGGDNQRFQIVPITN